uniref:BED-type domain-containing protein n=1 Tax=Panagrolaimus sp. ES5 TaxID=591445 RepID=A0AC34FA45_9BILA
MADFDTDYSFLKRGRKKTHPVWNYFFELKCPGVTDQIKCKSCLYETSDKNPQVLITHIKKDHSEEGGGTRSLWNKLEKESNEFIKYKNNQKLSSLMSGIRGSSSKQIGVLEELSKQVATFGSVTMDKNDIVGLLQTFANKVDPREASSIEGLVSALADPSTSGTSNGENEDEIQIIEKSPTPAAFKLEDWILVGTYNDHQSVEAARNAGKVVRHSVIPMKQGSKVKYRCNQWKRTHCPYRMHYVEQDGIYQLYEKGQHDHTPLHLHGLAQTTTCLNGSANTNVNFEAHDEPQQYMETDYLQSIISHAIHATTYESKNDLISEYSGTPLILEEQQQPEHSQQSTKAEETDASPCLTLPENLLNVFHEAVKTTESSENFTLSNSISNLLEVATQLQLVFTFDARNAAEFCFSKSSNPEMIVFVDVGSDVIVKTKHNDFIVNEERWRKADATQFIWAVRGILAKTFNG